MVFEKIREIIAEQTGKDVDEITLETRRRFFRLISDYQRY